MAEKVCAEKAWVRVACIRATRVGEPVEIILGYVDVTQIPVEQWRRVIRATVPGTGNPNEYPRDTNCAVMELVADWLRMRECVLEFQPRYDDYDEERQTWTY